jgi:hypothetical protein
LGEPVADASHEYVDPERLGRLVRWSLIALIVVSAVSAVSTAFEYLMLARMNSEGAFPGMEEAAQASDTRQTVAARLFLVTFTASGFLVLRWIWRSNKNLHATGAKMEFTPGWAVGWYFIPFAHLWKPYQVMREIWNRTASGGDSESQTLLRCWWAAWLISIFSDNISFRLSMSEELGPLIGSSITSMMGSVGLIAAAVFLLPIVARVTKNQRELPAITEVFS